MYGVTELESIHWLGPVALTHGMLERERDQELRNYLRTRCEMKPELCLARTLAEYTESNGGEFTQNDEKYGRIVDREPDRATLARDALLDILSDARSVAPMVQMGRYHAALNLQSYFYVFTHKTVSKEYIVSNFTISKISIRSILVCCIQLLCKHAQCYTQITYFSNLKDIDVISLAFIYIELIFLLLFL